MQDTTTSPSVSSDTASARAFSPPTPIDADAGPELLRRAAALRLPLRTVAAEANLDKHTVYRLRRAPARVEARTLGNVARVIDKHERAAVMRLLGSQRGWLREQFPNGLKFDAAALPGQREMPL